MVGFFKRLNRRLRGSRTYIVATIVTCLGVVEQTPWADIIPIEYKRYALVFVPVLFAVLRSITTTPPIGHALTRINEGDAP